MIVIKREYISKLKLTQTMLYSLSNGGAIDFSIVKCYEKRLMELKVINKRGYKYMKRENISIDLLLLSEDNPRLEASLGEDEVIAKMIEAQNDKLYELASDITLHGLNPLDVIGVYPSDVYNGYYEVGEGNRRVCAIKLLINPERIRDINTSLYSKFEELSKNFINPETIEVGVFEDVNSIKHWMEIRHMGEQGGKGLSKWNSVQKARFNRALNGKDDLLDFWDWMIEKEILTHDEIMSVTKTNWHRILRDKYFAFLKIQLKPKYSVLAHDIELFSERIKEIQRKLAGQTVAIVYDQERIEQFYNQVSETLYGIPYKDIINKESEQLSFDAKNESDGYTTNSENKFGNFQKSDFLITQNNNIEIKKDSYYQNAEDDQHLLGSQPIGRDLFNGCKTIIPWHYPIRTSNMRLNKIINELKALNADKYPNACGTLLRTLFELSAKVFLEKQDGTDHTATQFEQAIKKAANELRNQGNINNNQHSAIVSDIDNLRKIFNGYMHGTDSYPSSMALKNFFKSHKKFIEECLK